MVKKMFKIYSKKAQTKRFNCLLYGFKDDKEKFPILHRLNAHAYRSFIVKTSTFLHNFIRIMTPRFPGYPKYFSRESRMKKSREIPGIPVPGNPGSKP